MTATEAPNLYCTTVKVERDVENALKKEQARRVMNGEKKISINDLASELLTRAVTELLA